MNQTFQSKRVEPRRREIVRKKIIGPKEPTALRNINPARPAPRAAV
jgi:hypothetical protein